MTNVYAFWNNKGGVGKSYLTFQTASEYARVHPYEKVVVIDLCPQANSSGMLLGGIDKGEKAIEHLSSTEQPKKTISGYIFDRLRSPYVSPRSGVNFLTNVSQYNEFVPKNLFLICGDEELEIQSDYIRNLSNADPLRSWQAVHSWIRELINDILYLFNNERVTFFIDCNPSFTIYTELAISASNRLIIPFTADASSKRAIRSVLNLVYGIQRYPGQLISEYYINTQKYGMGLPLIYSYVGNRLTQMNHSSASAFRNVVTDIFKEIYQVWKQYPNLFSPRNGIEMPRSQRDFKKIFEEEINDSNTASVVSGSLGIPMNMLTFGYKDFLGRKVNVNSSQLDRLQPNISNFVNNIE